MVFLCESLDFFTKKRKSLFLLFLKERRECFALLKSVKEQKSQGAIHSFSSKKGDSHEKIKSKFSSTLKKELLALIAKKCDINFFKSDLLFLREN